MCPFSILNWLFGTLIQGAFGQGPLTWVTRLIQSLASGTFVLLLVVGNAGCFLRPETSFNIGGSSFRTSQEQSLSIVKPTFTKTGDGGMTFSADSVTIENKSVAVILAFVEQQKQFVEMQKAANAGITAALDGLTGLAAAVTNMVNMPAGLAHAILEGIAKTQAALKYEQGKLEASIGGAEQSISAAQKLLETQKTPTSQPATQ